MNDKHAFIEKLSAALKLRGVTELDAAPYLERFDKYWDRMTAESGETSESLSDIESVADTIAAQIAERGEEIDRLAERTMTVDAVAPTEEVAIPAAVITEYDDCEYLYQDEAECLIPAEELEALGGDAADEYSGEGNRLPDYKAEENMPASTTFKLLTVASLPITVPLALVFLASFGVLWALVFAFMAAAVGLVVVLTAFGAAVSLVGIVYGVIQMFTGNVPVGLYEIGLGVTVIGAVMLVCILLYNFAVRLMPIVSKMILKLFKYTLKKLSELYSYLKKEGSKL